MREEVERCRRILARMRVDAGDPAGERFAARLGPRAGRRLSGRARRSPIALSRHADETTAAATTALPRHAFGQALRGLVDNARQASPPARRSACGWPPTTKRRGWSSRSPIAAPASPPALLARVGEPFFTTKPAGQGMGLGIFLARAIVERLGGELSIRSAPGARTTATLWLPGAGAPVKTSRGAILLVDDDEVFRERLARALRDRGYDVATAADHDGAVAAATARKPDFAIVDLRMPGLSGLALIGPLHAIAPGARIVVLTGYGSITSAVEALRAGAHDYLSKPVDADQIIAALTGEPARPAEAAPAPPDAGARRVGAHSTRSWPTAARTSPRRRAGWGSPGARCS